MQAGEAKSESGKTRDPVALWRMLERGRCLTFPSRAPGPPRGGGDLQIASLVHELYTKHICGSGGRRVCSSLSSMLSWRAKLEYSGGRGGTHGIATSSTLARASDGACTMACTLDPYRHHGSISVTLRGLRLCSCHV